MVAPTFSGADGVALTSSCKFGAALSSSGEGRASLPFMGKEGVATACSGEACSTSLGAVRVMPVSLDAGGTYRHLWLQAKLEAKHERNRWS